MTDVVTPLLELVYVECKTDFIALSWDGRCYAKCGKWNSHCHT